MPVRTTRSTRFLTGFATLLLIIATAFTAFLVVGAAFGFGADGNDVGVHTQVPTARITDLPRHAIAPDHVRVLVRVPDASDKQIRLAAGRDVTMGLLFVAALWLVRAVVRSVRDGDPFTGSNVARLRSLALVILIGTPIALFVSSMFESALATSAGVEGTGVNLTMPGGAFIAGVGALVLSEVFAAGVGMRQDLEGTV